MDMKLMVQTERILANLRILQKQAGSTPLIPVLEANAGGLGDVEIARLLQEAGVGTIAVARLEEAVRIADAVRGLDILLLTPYSAEEDVAAILQYDIIGAVGSNDAAVLFSSLSRKMRCRARCSCASTSAWAVSATRRRTPARRHRPSSTWKMWS